MANLNLAYNVEATTELSPGVKGFVFNPEILEIYVLGHEEVEQVTMVKVKTILIQNVANGVIKAERQYLFPVAAVSTLINGFNPATMQPTISTQALDAFLVPFDLRTVDVQEAINNEQLTTNNDQSPNTDN